MRLFLDILAAVAFVMSAITWMLMFLHNRKKVMVSVEKSISYAGQHIFLLVIENRSRLSISINRITMLSDNGLCSCWVYPKRLASFTMRTGDTIDSKREVFSAKRPITLGALAATSDYFAFDDPQQVLSADAKLVSFQLDTTRGSIKLSPLARNLEDNLENMY